MQLVMTWELGDHSDHELFVFAFEYESKERLAADFAAAVREAVDRRLIGGKAAYMSGATVHFHGLVFHAYQVCDGLWFADHEYTFADYKPPLILTLEEWFRAHEVKS